jgi:hypothetical protein
VKPVGQSFVFEHPTLSQYYCSAASVALARCEPSQPNKPNRRKQNEKTDYDESAGAVRHFKRNGCCELWAGSRPVQQQSNEDLQLDVRGRPDLRFCVLRQHLLSMGWLYL